MKNKLYCDPQLSHVDDAQIPLHGILIGMVLGVACWFLFGLLVYVWVTG